MSRSVRDIALFALLVLCVGHFGAWFFISNRAAKMKAVQAQAEEVERRFVIAKEIATGMQDEADDPRYTPETMGAGKADGEVRNAIRNILRQQNARVLPPSGRIAVLSFKATIDRHLLMQWANW